jgi:hypothetical protein
MVAEASDLCPAAVESGDVVRESSSKAAGKRIAVAGHDVERQALVGHLEDDLDAAIVVAV